MVGKKSVAFKPEKDIPSLNGKIILVTGGNIGPGQQSILKFSRHSPAQIWLATRNLEKGQAAADEIRKKVPGAPIKLLEMDLASADSLGAYVRCGQSKLANVLFARQLAEKYNYPQ